LQEVDGLTALGAPQWRRAQGLDAGTGKVTGMHGYFGHAMVQHDGGYGEGILSRTPERPTAHALPVPQGGERGAWTAISGCPPAAAG